MIYHLVDIKDEFIVYTGSLAECQRAQEESYGGLTILPDTHLLVEKINKINRAIEEF